MMLTLRGSIKLDRCYTDFRRVCETCSSIVTTVSNTHMIAINYYLLHRLKLVHEELRSLLTEGPALCNTVKS